MVFTSFECTTGLSAALQMQLGDLTATEKFYLAGFDNIPQPNKKTSQKTIFGGQKRKKERAKGPSEGFEASSPYAAVNHPGVMPLDQLDLIYWLLS